MNIMASRNLIRLFQAGVMQRMVPRIVSNRWTPLRTKATASLRSPFAWQSMSQPFSNRFLSCDAKVSEVYGPDWPEHDFTQFAEECLEEISEKISSLGCDSSSVITDFDIEFSQGVLTISMGSQGTYVLNTQTPNRQIWMSSPVSGPWRYAWNPDEKQWVSTRDGHALATCLEEEFSSLFQESVAISFTGVT